MTKRRFALAGLATSVLAMSVFTAGAATGQGVAIPAGTVQTFTCETEFTGSFGPNEVTLECAAGPVATATPTEEPTTAPTATPTTAPTPTPTLAPTPTPTATPTPVPTATPVPPQAGDFILMSRAELMSLPTSGPAWNALVSAANSLGSVNLGDQNEKDDTRLLAAALVAARTGNGIADVRAALADTVGSQGSNALAVARNTMSVVLAADFIDYRDPAFVSWVSGLRTQIVSGRSLTSTHEDRPNNWGTHAGAGRIAVDLYLGDEADLADAIRVFRGWLGDRSQYANFDYGDLDWQSNPSQPVGINPMGATIQGHDVDGVLPDDQRRAGGFDWPPPQENYAYEALQGALMQAELLHEAGYPAYQWSNGAIGRAFDWLANVADFPAEGDDRWENYIVNFRYGTQYAESGTTSMGKNFGFTEWLYGERP